MTPTLSKLINLTNGVVFSEKFYVNGRLHRDPSEGPACVLRDRETGTITWRMYKVNGRFHREGGPAEISFNADGNPVTEVYWLKGVIHRDPKEGPAMVKHVYEGGYWGGQELFAIETYVVFGSEYRHPADGPSWIKRDVTTGKVIEQDYSSAEQKKPGDPRRPPRRVPRRGETDRQP